MRYRFTPIKIAINFLKMKNDIMVKMWKNQNSCTLLLGMYDGTAAMENSLTVSQKLDIEIASKAEMKKEKRNSIRPADALGLFNSGHG